MITVRLLAGLGNQMFQYAAGRALAVRHRVPLVLDTSFFYGPTPGHTPRTYGLGAFVLEGKVDATPGQSPLDYGRIRRRLARMRISGSVYRKEESFAYRDAAWKAMPSNAYLDGYWQSEFYFCNVAELIRADFRLARPLSDEAVEIGERIARSDAALSIHVRRGDYLEARNLERFAGICDESYYALALALVRREVTKASAFVFSDDIAWCRDNFDAGRSTHFVDAGSDVEQLILMSRCRHHIIANSSFSWWGAWLANPADHLVVAPVRWLRDASLDTSTVVPLRWKRVGN